MGISKETSVEKLSKRLGENEEARELEETIEIARAVISERDKLSRHRGFTLADR